MFSSNYISHICANTNYSVNAPQYQYFKPSSRNWHSLCYSICTPS